MAPNKRKRSMVAIEPIELPRTAKEVAEGEAAFVAGQTIADCPYPQGQGLDGNKARSAWMTGWYDEKMRAKLGHIWNKYGTTYP